MNFLNQEVKKYIAQFLKLEPNLALSIGIITPLDDEIYFFSDIFPDTAKYLYEVGSISKVYLSCLLAKLVQEKKILLEDSIDRYLDLPKGKVYPTILSLATHTSGYAPLLSFRFIWAYLLKSKGMKQNLYKGLKSDRLYKQINSFHLKSKKYRYHYSDMNGAVLGEIISKVENKPFDIVMNDFLKTDLKLQNSRLSVGTAYNLESYYRKRIRYHLNWEPGDVYAAAGGIMSSISDSITFLRKQVEHDPSYLSMTQERYTRIRFGHRPMAMGLGWHMYPDGNYMFHKGGTSCFRASYLIEKKRKIGVVVLANVIGNREYNTTKLSMMLCKNIKDLLREIRTKKHQMAYNPQSLQAESIQSA
ncbi:MAG: serine hydrolase [Candidatus Izemoplasmatales bacterium]|nr:serine hydrolase [Candidatus Izemoplasmatales bacterium]